MPMSIIPSGEEHEASNLDADADEDRQWHISGRVRGAEVVPTIVVTEPEGEPEMEMVGT